MTANPGNLRHRPHCNRPDPQVRVDARGTRHSCPGCGRYVFVAAEAPQQALTPAQARTLATDLIGDLTAHAGDPDAVRAVLLRWLDIAGTTRLSMACMSAIQIVFADCLTRVAQVPPGALSLEPPTERNAA